jgi:hypothetical protein
MHLPNAGTLIAFPALKKLKKVYLTVYIMIFEPNMGMTGV